MEAYERLEHHLSRHTGMPHVVACSSGTAALHLAMETLRLPKGSHVIVPDFSMIACARAVSMAGLSPLFIDCIPETLVLNTDKLTDDLFQSTSHLEAILAVHIYGRRVDMDKVHSIAAQEKLTVIEDMAELHGICPHANTPIACWSFYKNKIVHGEEGGAVGFRNPDLAKHAKQLRSQGFTEAHDFNHIPRGCNYRLANLLAYPIIDSLGAMESNIQKRRRIELDYDKHCPAEWRMESREVVWVYDFRIPGLNGTQQTEIIKRLNAIGIPARHSFKPLSMQPEYSSSSGASITPQRLPWRAFEASQEVMYLPCRPDVDSEDTAIRAFQLIQSTLSSL